MESRRDFFVAHMNQPEESLNDTNAYYRPNGSGDTGGLTRWQIFGQMTWCQENGCETRLLPLCGVFDWTPYAATSVWIVVFFCLFCVVYFFVFWSHIRFGFENKKSVPLGKFWISLGFLDFFTFLSSKFSKPWLSDFSLEECYRQLGFGATLQGFSLSWGSMVRIGWKGVIFLGSWTNPNEISDLKVFGKKIMKRSWKKDDEAINPCKFWWFLIRLALSCEFQICSFWECIFPGS